MPKQIFFSPARRDNVSSLSASSYWKCLRKAIESEFSKLKLAAFPTLVRQPSVYTSLGKKRPVFPKASTSGSKGFFVTLTPLETDLFSTVSWVERIRKNRWTRLKNHTTTFLGNQITLGYIGDGTSFLYALSITSSICSWIDSRGLRLTTLINP